MYSARWRAGGMAGMGLPLLLLNSACSQVPPAAEQPPARYNVLCPSFRPPPNAALRTEKPFGRHAVLLNF